MWPSCSPRVRRPAVGRGKPGGADRRWQRRHCHPSRCANVTTFTAFRRRTCDRQARARLHRTALGLTARRQQIVFGLLGGSLQEVVQPPAALLFRKRGKLLCLAISEMTCSRAEVGSSSSATGHLLPENITTTSAQCPVPLRSCSINAQRVRRGSGRYDTAPRGTSEALS